MLRYDLAQGLRERSTDVERLLWKLLRNRQLENYKFRRQQPIGRYIVDFVCQEQRLIIELDGGQHAERIEQDQRRDRFLQNAGYRILRFWNIQLQQQTEGVIETILQTLESPVTPRPALRATSPSRGEARLGVGCFLPPSSLGRRGMNANRASVVRGFASPLEGEAALRPRGAGRVRGA